MVFISNLSIKRIVNLDIMKKPLVNPLTPNNKELKELVEFYNETLGFCPNSIKTMFIRPQIAFGFISLNKAVMKNKGKLSSKLKWQ